MNIFFCVNCAYAEKVLVSIISILENNRERLINFYILSSDFSDAAKQIIDKTLNGYKDFTIEYIYVSKDKFRNFKNNIGYISIETYYRYIIADIFPKLNKGLYLDADLVCNGNLDICYDTNLDDVYCAGVEDLFIKKIGYKYNIGLDSDNVYINTGVLLLNLDKIRSDSMSEELLRNTVTLAERIQYQDQDIINITFKGMLKQLDSKYNFTSENTLREKEKIKEAIIIHYTGPLKPWNKKCKHKLRNIWHTYYEKMLNLQGKRKSSFYDKVINITKNFFSK